MKIILVNQTDKKKYRILENQLQQFCDVLNRCLAVQKVRNKSLLKKSEITCVFLTKKEMQILNNSFRKKNKPTDVLSFQPMETGSIGELVFCPDVLIGQAKKQKHSLSMELSYMFIHGLLHLLDYDHEVSKKEEQIMFRLQDRVFQQLTDAHLDLKLILEKK